MKTDLERRTVLARTCKWLAAVGCLQLRFAKPTPAGDNRRNRGDAMQLPPPATEGTVSLEQTIQQRRTVRAYRPQQLSLQQLSQLLWAAQGITEAGGYKRAAASAGALYPMDVYAIVGNDAVTAIGGGVFRYSCTGHELRPVTDGDLRSRLAKAALSQTWMAKAPINLVITAEYARAASKYGKRAVRYAMIEAGHIGQNIFLQAEALGLKAGIVGAFHDKDINRILKIPSAHEPLLIMPVGYAQ